jgi:hypothetical protein
MKTEKDITRKELWGLFFFGCLILGSGWIIMIAKFLIFDQPSERVEEWQDDWPIVLFSLLLVTIGWRGRSYFKKELKEENDKETKRPQ